MSKVDIWMPLYIRDYLADTQHLSDASNGHYLLAIMAYWTNGPLPNDDAIIARICRMSPPDRPDAPDMRPLYLQILRGFFQIGDDALLHHKRIDRELSIARSNSSKAREAALKKWENARNKANASKSSNDAVASVGHMLGACSSPSPSPVSPYGDTNTLLPLSDLTPRARWNVDHAIAIYRAYPRHKAPEPGKAAIIRALKRLEGQGQTEPFNFLLSKTQLFAAAKVGADPQFIPYPATWFNSGGYLENPETWNDSPASAAPGRLAQPPGQHPEPTPAWARPRQSPAQPAA